VTDGVDHRNDHQPERECDADVAECVVASSMIAPAAAKRSAKVPISSVSARASGGVLICAA